MVAILLSYWGLFSGAMLVQGGYYTWSHVHVLRSFYHLNVETLAGFKHQSRAHASLPGWSDSIWQHKTRSSTPGWPWFLYSASIFDTGTMHICIDKIIFEPSAPVVIHLGRVCKQHGRLTQVLLKVPLVFYLIKHILMYGNVQKIGWIFCWFESYIYIYICYQSPNLWIQVMFEGFPEN